MPQFFQVARPDRGHEAAEVVRGFVFMANLAAQEVTGETGASVSVARALQRLAGSAESDSLLLVLAESVTDSDGYDAPAVSGLGYPLLSATLAPGQPDPAEELEYLGYLHLSLPQLEDRQLVEFECVLDAAHLPVPGQELEPEGYDIYARLLAEAEQLAQQLDRSILQLWQTRPVEPGPGEAAIDTLLETRGYTRGLEELQGLLPLMEISRQPAPLPAGLTHTVWHDRDLPEPLIDGVLALLRQASLDMPRGVLETEPQIWDRRRLAAAEARRRNTGLEVLLSILYDRQGPVALCEIHRHPASEPGTLEQGVTVVLPRARRQGLGFAVKHHACVAAQRRWPRAERIYTSNAASHTAVRAINAALGMRLISEGTTWQKILTPPD